MTSFTYYSQLKMGNSQSTDQLMGQSKLSKKYHLTKKKEGYAVLVGSDWNMSISESGRPESRVGRNLSKMEKALKTCRIETLAPFLSHSSDEAQTTFNKEDFKRLCLLHFDNDMLRNLGQYSSYFFYFCGFGNENGVLTSDRQCLQYSTIVKNIINYTKPSNKPTVLVFDCNYHNDSTVNINTIKRLLEEEMGTELENTLVCFSFLCIESGNQTGLFTAELARVLEQFHHLLPLPDLIEMAGSKTQLQVNNSIEGFQGPECINQLTAQFMLVQDPTPEISLEPEKWIKHCCTLLKQQSTTSSTRSTSNPVTTSPGSGYNVFIMYASDACGFGDQRLSGVLRLAKSLKILGFDVYCDTISKSEEDSEEREWMRWYVTHISLCENIILVCSPLMAKRFQMASQSTFCTSSAASVMLLNGIYQNLAVDSETRLKFFPVVLSTKHGIDCVPTLFAGSKVYNLNGPFPQSFNTLVFSNDYDILVIKMSRQTVPNSETNLGPVVQLPDNQKDSRKYHELDTKYRHKSEGRVTIHFQQVIFLVHPLVLPSNITELYELPRGHKPVLIPTPIRLPPYQQVELRPVNNPVIPVRPVQYPPVYNPVTPPIPHKPVSKLDLLWLSSEVVQWKFLGRYLHVRDTDLERIEHENPRDTTEQCYQMLSKWMNQNKAEDVNYGVLLNALKQAESEKMCQELVAHINHQV